VLAKAVSADPAERQPSVAVLRREWREVA